MYEEPGRLDDLIATEPPVGFKCYRKVTILISTFSYYPLFPMIILLSANRVQSPRKLFYELRRTAENNNNLPSLVWVLSETHARSRGRDIRTSLRTIPNIPLRRVSPITVAWVLLVVVCHGRAGDGDLDGREQRLPGYVKGRDGLQYPTISRNHSSSAEHPTWSVSRTSIRWAGKTLGGALSVSD